MTQDERWMLMWRLYMDFLASEKRRPSKYKPEERRLVNWLKHNQKLSNQGLLPYRRRHLFAQLLAEANRLQRVNQYAYSIKS